MKHNPKHSPVEGYEISSDRGRLDMATIHAYLTASYWSPGIPRALVERALEHSLCFGIYRGALQVGFARVITDRATFAYLADVFVLEAHRGQGLSKWLMEVVLEHRDLQGLRNFMLRTLDAQGLYERFGFRPLDHPERVMEIHRKDVYRTP